jgi:hypothetical protein
VVLETNPNVFTLRGHAILSGELILILVSGAAQYGTQVALQTPLKERNTQKDFLKILECIYFFLLGGWLKM